ncbi:hypothetical protein Rhein_3607 [Rheinheimera sp. A13L]|nr:hypothetical protein Rhein_3607 [Rheinheimera sp. A13L]
MNPLRRCAVVFLIAALTQFTAVADESLTHSEAIKHAEHSIVQLQQQQSIAQHWSSISPKYAQKASSATQKHLWVVRFIDPQARKFNEQNLYLILTDSGQLIEYSYQLPTAYLLVQP